MTDPRWTALVAMTPALVQELREVGVVRVEYVAAYPQQSGAWVWLATATDAERDVLVGSEPQLLARVGVVAQDRGIDPGEITGVRLQSEETVARDFAGSWFYALR